MFKNIGSKKHDLPIWIDNLSRFGNNAQTVPIAVKS